MIKKRDATTFCDTATNPGKPPLRSYQMEGIQRLKEAFDKKREEVFLSKQLELEKHWLLVITQ